jgi:iron(III) transport system permease protein
MRSFSIPLVLATRGNEVIASAIWRVWQRGMLPEAAAYGVVLMIVLLPMTLLLRRFMVQSGTGLK